MMLTMTKRLAILALCVSIALLAACAPDESPASAQAGEASAELTQAAANLEAEEAAPAAEPQIYSDYGDLYLFAPITSTETYLMDAEGTAVFTWASQYSSGQSVYLLEDGSLLHTANIGSRSFTAGGQAGAVQIIAPDGRVTWEFEYSSSQFSSHHDVELLPNGNVLMIAWELKTEAEAIAAGRHPSTISDGELWPDHVIEVDPDTNEIVWEWHIWDHLIQDYDPGAENYGVVAEHPELIDVNYGSDQGSADWTHINSIDYNAELDQIMLSVHGFSEIWIIDHATTTEEAAGPAGDLLYRWGNPQAYGAGGAADQQLYRQHDAQWIEEGLPGEGNILIFNNGSRRDRAYSSIDEIAPPLNADGGYTLEAGGAYGPTAPVWSYSDPDNFFADHISGVQRLASGNTLICDGPNGRFFEVTPDGEVVWEYDYGGQVFRVVQIAASDPALANLDLQPGETLIGSDSGPGGPGPGGQRPTGGGQGLGPRPGGPNN